MSYDRQMLLGEYQDYSSAGMPNNNTMQYDHYYQPPAAYFPNGLPGSAPMVPSSSSGSDSSAYASSRALSEAPRSPMLNSPVIHPSSYSPATPTRRSSKPSRTPSERSTDRYVCIFPGCPSNFSRPADLARHQMTVHYKIEHLIDCPVSNCTRKADNGFTRQDHLNEHLRKFHSQPISKRQSRSSPSNDRR